MKNNFSLLLFVLSNSIWAQSDSLSDSKLCIKLAPLGIMDAYNGSALRFQLEKKLYENVAACFELGTYIPGINGRRRNNGIVVRAERKSYLNKENLTSGAYFSVEIMYKYQDFTTSDSIRSTPNYLKDYSVTKNVLCLNLKLGIMDIYWNRFVLEGFICGGIRFKETKSGLTAKENDNIISSGDYSPNVSVSSAGQFVLPNFELGIRLGYKIK